RLAARESRNSFAARSGCPPRPERVPVELDYPDVHIKAARRDAAASPAFLMESGNDLIARRRPADIGQSIVETGALPLVIHCGGAVAGHDHLETRIGGVPRGMLDRHIRPGTGNDDGFSPEAAQQ